MSCTMSFLLLFNFVAGLFYDEVKQLPEPSRSYVFEHIDRTAGLASNIVLAIMQDQKGFMWFGTNNGLQRYDGEKFIHYRYQPSNPNSPASDIIESLLEDGKGNIWMASSEAVTIFSPVTEKFTRYLLPTDINNKISFKRWKLQECYGRICLSSLLLPDAHYAFDSIQARFVPIEYRETIQEKGADSFLDNRQDGVSLKKNEPIVYLTDHRGNTWAAGEKLKVRYTHSPAYLDVNPASSSRYSLDCNLIYSLTEDRDGTLWLGTDRGVYYFNPHQQQFYSVSLPALNNKSERALVSGFLESADGSIWVSSLNGGIAVYNQHMQLIKKFPQTATKDSLLHSVWHLLQAPQGDIWAACMDGYLARISAQTGQVDYFRPSALDGQMIVKGALDNSDHIWWGTDKGMLVRHELSTNSFVCLPLQDTKTRVGWGKIKRILPDKDLYLWVATERGGVLQINKRTGHLHHTFSTQSKPLALLSNDTGDMLWYRDSTLAVSSSLGLYFIDTHDYSLQTFTTEEGLPANAILDLIKADSSTLLFTTQSSLNRYHIPSGKLTTYGRRDGILHESFAFSTAYRLKNGRILLGTLQDFFYFHPDSLAKRAATPQVSITGFKALGNYLPLNSSDKGAPKLQLSYQQNFFQIEYASFMYYEADKISYYYKLEGVDKEWVKAGHIRFASYTGVPGGNYLFKVKAERNDSGNSSTITTLFITIAHPFWKSPYFILSCFLLIGALLAFLDRLRIKRLIAMQRVRSRIAQDLHDDMGSTLSTVHILSELARQQVSTDIDKTSSYLSKINRYSYQMLEAIDDIVWSINPFNDSMQNVTSRMREFATELLEAKDIYFSLQVDKGVEALHLPMEVRYDCFMIFKEAINNAAKHAQCNRVQASFTLCNKQLLLVIVDNGKGFEQISASGDNAGNGLLNMQSRAKAIKAIFEINTGQETGTKITLQVPVSTNRTYFKKKDDSITTF